MDINQENINALDKIRVETIIISISILLTVVLVMAGATTGLSYGYSKTK
jgi:hypothetical protein